MLEFMLPRRALVVEVRGRGGSESPPTGYTAAEHANDLRAAFDEEHIDRYHLMTFSRGTTWVLDLVLAAPERCASGSVGDYWAREPRECVTSCAQSAQTVHANGGESDRG